MKLTHTRLLVDNYKDCFLFYRNVLGFEVTWGDETSNYADFKATEDFSLAIFDRRQMVESVGKTFEPLKKSPDTAALIFRVESVEQTYQEMKNQVEFITQPTEQRDWGIKVAHFRDPAGNLIEINESLNMW
ncbi:VOC family protein [Virgibacillus kekensis]|uniref:VOC family protein n=1 Tax=Virgibacillus kekensis TaxID=202261 RepID=A0ABV9DLR1_9BACI